MQSTDVEEIKAALWEQAYHPCTRVRWGVAQVMAIKRSKGQLLALLRGRGRWHPVEAVTIERPPVCPTGACDLNEEGRLPPASKRRAAGCDHGTGGKEEATPFSSASDHGAVDQKRSGMPGDPSSS